MRPPRGTPQARNRSRSVQILLAFADSRLPWTWGGHQGGFRPWGPSVPPPPPSWPGNVADRYSAKSMPSASGERRVRRARSCDLLRELALLKTEYRSRLRVVTPNAVSISKHNGDLKMAPRYICDIRVPSRLRSRVLISRLSPCAIAAPYFKIQQKGKI